MEEYKTCTKCLKSLELSSNFIEQKNKEIIAKRNKEYYEANKEKIAEKGKIYRDNNKEKRKEYDKQYREKNKDVLDERKQKWCSFIVLCECGCSIRRDSMTKHKNSKKHQKIMKELNTPTV